MSPIFKGGVPRLSFILLVILAFVLMFGDLKYAKVHELRSALALLLTPVQWLVDMPTRIADDLSDILVSKRALVRENTLLRSDVVVLDEKIQQMASLMSENKQLRALLNAKPRIANQVQLAELIGINPDPFQHQVILGKGEEEGAFLGQPVLDAGGVLGQVIDVAPYTSRVMLITDARHALPVEVNRNGLRTIAIGKGDLDELDLEHVPDTADIQKGDLLVTSGLGGRFPHGYPVARVTRVTRDPGKPFSIVKAVPTARLDKSRFLLMVEPLVESVPDHIESMP